MGVEATGNTELVELLIRQIVQMPIPESCRQICTPRAMLVVAALVVPTSVMENREQLHNTFIGSGLLGESHPYLIDSEPMTDAMDAVPVDLELIPDVVENFFGDHGHYGI